MPLLLTLLIWIPIVGGVIALTFGGNDQKPHIARSIALVTAFLDLVLCIPLYMNFDTHTSVMQFVERLSWIPAYKIEYYLGVDGLSMPLIMLTAFTGLIVVMAGCSSIRFRVSQYMATFLIMQGTVIGVFASLDGMLFYVFWEAMLIPMYLSIGIWGSDNRSYASIKFFLYTFFGSALMLVVILFLRAKAHSFSILDFYALPLTLHEQYWVFLAFFLGFAVKIPMWPVHTWLPDAHTEAPAGGSVVLAALMLKLGTYGFIRFSLPMTPDASQALSSVMIALSLVAIIYIGLVALVQTDMKRLIAYSSIAHMGFVTLGTFMIYPIMAASADHHAAAMSLEGAMVQMIAHAFGSGAMFVGVGILYDRLHTRLISSYGGVAHVMPFFAAIFMLFAMSNVGLPGTAGFVGEFMVLLSASKANIWIVAGAASTLIWGAAYTLWMYKRVFLGAVVEPKVSTLEPLLQMERATLILLAVMVVFLGLYPQFLLNVFHGTVGHLLELSTQTKLG